MAQTTVKKCDCKHKEQDRMYGIGMRLHNAMSSDKHSKWRCTVCGKEKP